GQGFEQIGVMRSAIQTHIVHRVQEPFAKEVVPESVDCRAGKVRIVASRYPVREDRPKGLPAVEDRCLPKQEASLDDAAVAVWNDDGTWRRLLNLHLALTPAARHTILDYCGHRTRSDLLLGSVLEMRAREECGNSPKICLLERVVRVVVTLAAFQPDPQE